MKLFTTPLDGLWEIHSSPRADERGRFTRIFCEDSFSEIRTGIRFVQVNYSITKTRGTVRGMHFQHAPASEAKLIRCLRGSVFDVAVDLRPESSTFGRWYGLELSAANERQVFIPEGFAHGFQTLSDDAELLYQHTAPYTPSAEGGVRYDDITLGINWPLAISLVSDRDASLPSLASALTGRSA